MSTDILLSRLSGVKRTGPGKYLAKCPSHDDRHPSLSVRELGDGRTLLHCWSGCDTADVLGSIGLEFSDLYPPRVVDDSNRNPRERRPFSAADALQLISHEVNEAALLIAVCARTPNQLTAERRARLMQRASTVRSALLACGGRS